MSEMRIIQRFTPKHRLGAMPTQQLLLSPGAQVGEYVPLRNADPLLPSGIVGQQVGEVADVPVQQVYTRAQVDVLCESGIEVVIAEVTNRTAQAAYEKASASVSLPEVREEIRDLVVNAYKAGATRKPGGAR